MQTFSQFLELINPQPGFKVLDVTSHADALTEAVRGHLEPFGEHRLGLALYPGEHQPFESSENLKVQNVPSFDLPFRALPRDNDIVILRDVFQHHTQIERVIKTVYTTLANTGDIIIVTRSEEADITEQMALLDRLEFRAPNSIEMLEGYTVVVAKKMHMWGNGL